jgi:D-glycero-alpha-D-manno-heptose 1-phosphate guanylyltransferase
VVNGRQVSSFAEKGILGLGLINAGCYVLPINALDMFPINQPFSIETDFFMPEVSRSVIEVFVTEGTFIDIGIPEDYVRAQIILADV